MVVKLSNHQPPIPVKIYPYQTPEGIIELVEKQEYDGLSLLAHELATLRAEDMATINDLRKQLQDAVKLMEEVPVKELDYNWDNTGESALDGFEAVRTRLIQAAKGEWP